MMESTIIITATHDEAVYIWDNDIIPEIRYINGLGNNKWHLIVRHTETPDLKEIKCRTFKGLQRKLQQLKNHYNEQN